MAMTRQDAADPSRRANKLAFELAESGRLSGALRVPNTVGNLALTADLRAGLINCSVDSTHRRKARRVAARAVAHRQLQHALGAIRGSNDSSRLPTHCFSSPS